MINLSIVSHQQNEILFNCLNTLAKSCGHHTATDVLVWVTINIPEPSFIKQIQQTEWPFDLRIIQNAVPLGFGANHNQAFLHAQAQGGGKWFCVMNPDVWWPADADDFWTALFKDVFESSVGLVCPIQVDEHGAAQDFARPLITPWGLAARMWRRIHANGAGDQVLPLSQADWVNGACMVWRSNVFAALGGFDERYFMYCEDTDICLRMQLAGYRIEQGAVKVVHLAQRKTGKSWRHLAWHISSLLRLWLSAAFWRYVWRFKIKTGFKSKN